MLVRLISEALSTDDGHPDAGVDLTRVTYDMKQAMAAAVREFAGTPSVGSRYATAIEAIIQDFDASLEALIERTLERTMS